MQLRKETHVGYQAELDQCGHEERDLGLDMSGGVTEGKQRVTKQKREALAISLRLLRG